MNFFNSGGCALLIFDQIKFDKTKNRQKLKRFFDFKLKEKLEND